MRLFVADFYEIHAIGWRWDPILLNAYL